MIFQYPRIGVPPSFCRPASAKRVCRGCTGDFKNPAGLDKEEELQDANMINSMVEVEDTDMEWHPLPLRVRGDCHADGSW